MTPPNDTKSALADPGVYELQPLVKLKDDYFRIQISNTKKRSPLSTKRFYGDVIKADNRFVEAYRKYTKTKLSALKVVNIHVDMVR